MLINNGSKELSYEDDNIYTEKEGTQLGKAIPISNTSGNYIDNVTVVFGKAFAGKVGTKSQLDDNWIIAKTDNKVLSKYRYTTNTKGTYLINLNNNYGAKVTDYVSYIQMPSINEGSGFNLCADPTNLLVENNDVFKGKYDIEYSSDQGDDVKTFNYSKDIPSNHCDITSIKISVDEIVDKADIDFKIPLSIDYDNIQSLTDISTIKMTYNAKVNDIDNIAEYESQYQLLGNQISGNISVDENYENIKTNNLYEGNIKIDLVDSNNKVVDTTQTDINGDYNFELPNIDNKKYRNYQYYQVVPHLPSDEYIYAPKDNSIIDPQTGKSDVIDAQEDNNDMDIIIAKNVEYDIDADKYIICLGKQGNFNISITNGSLGHVQYDKDYLTINQNSNQTQTLAFTGNKVGTTEVDFPIKDGYGRDVTTKTIEIIVAAITPEIPDIIETIKPEITYPVKEVDGKLVMDYDFECGTVYSADMFKVKDTEYIKYTLTFDNNVLIIKAEAVEGYTIIGDTEWHIQLPVIEKCPIEINDITAPTLNTSVECNKVPTINPSTTEGITWDVQHDADNFKYIVTAKANDGYQIKDGIQTSWTLEYTIEVCNIDKPNIVDPTKPEVNLPTEEKDGVIIVEPGVEITCDKQAEIKLPSVTGLTYTQETLENGNIKVSVKADKGYKLDENARTEWVFKLPEVKPCIIEIDDIIAPKLDTNVKCNEIPNVITEDITGIIWDVQHDEDNFKYMVSAKAKDGYKIKDGIQTSWELEYTIEVCNIDKPNIIDPTKPEVTYPVKEVDGKLVLDYDFACDTKYSVDMFKIKESNELTYQVEVKGNQLIIKATAKKGYVLTGTSEWIISLPVIKSCPIEVDFLSVEANGQSTKEKTTKLKLTFTNEIDNLSLEDLKVVPRNRTINNIEIKSIIDLSNGEYELGIEGNWEDKTTVVVLVNKDMYKFNTDAKTTDIYNVGINIDTDIDTNKVDTNNDKEIKEVNETSSLPDTGSNYLMYVISVISSITLFVIPFVTRNRFN